MIDKLIHSYTHTSIHSYTHTQLYSHTLTITHSYTHTLNTLIVPYTHPLIHSYTHTLIHSYTHTLLCVGLCKCKCYNFKWTKLVVKTSVLVGNGNNRREGQKKWKTTEGMSECMYVCMYVRVWEWEWMAAILDIDNQSLTHMHLYRHTYISTYTH